MLTELTEAPTTNTDHYSPNRQHRHRHNNCETRTDRVRQSQVPHITIATSPAPTSPKQPPSWACVLRSGGACGSGTTSAGGPTPKLRSEDSSTSVLSLVLLGLTLPAGSNGGAAARALAEARMLAASCRAAASCIVRGHGSGTRSCTAATRVAGRQAPRLLSGYYCSCSLTISSRARFISFMRSISRPFNYQGSKQVPVHEFVQVCTGNA